MINLYRAMILVLTFLVFSSCASTNNKVISSSVGKHQSKIIVSREPPETPQQPCQEEEFIPEHIEPQSEEADKLFTN